MTTKLQQFLATPAPSLGLQAKFLKEGRRNSMESLFGLQYPAKQDSLTAQEAGKVQRLPESIWVLAHKVVAFTQSHVQQSGWTTGTLDWMFVQEPWWALEPTDLAQYAALFSKAEWYDAMETLGASHRTMRSCLASQKPAPEKHAVMWFLHDARNFAEDMYRRL
jgi:hypothetical protein